MERPEGQPTGNEASQAEDGRGEAQMTRLLISAFTGEGMLSIDSLRLTRASPSRSITQETLHELRCSSYRLEDFNGRYA